MQFINKDIISTEKLTSFSRNGVEVFVLRTDKLHPVISGNKWFKLKHYLQQAKAKQAQSILTFGGAYSNHIVATAYACRQTNLQSIGIIRGEEPAAYSHTLQDAIKYGMRLYFTSRDDYRQKKIPEALSDSSCFIIPEGGYGVAGADGMATLQYKKEDFDIICCAVGTGTMMAGLINSKAPQAEVLGISVLKNNYKLSDDVLKLLNDKTQKVNINHDYHFGGYAKLNQELIRFMNNFYQQTAIPTDFVYSGKLFYGVNNLIEKNHFRQGSRILIIHCGGIQGNDSLPKDTLIF